MTPTTPPTPPKPPTLQIPDSVRVLGRYVVTFYDY